MNKTNEEETRKIKKGNLRIKWIINSIVGLIEGLLAIRLIFKLFGANIGNEFVKLIYSVTEYFIGYFKNIFPHTPFGERGVFEPETVIAMIVISIINGFIMKLLSAYGSNKV